MTSVSAQIRSADEAICKNIELLSNQRALLSQNVLAQLRNLVEGVVVRLHSNSPDAEFNYESVEPGLAFVKGRANFSFLARFHKLIQKSASHYTLSEDASERLMLKYYEFLHRIRTLLEDVCSVSILRNLEDFPVDLDPSLREYHEKIADRIEATRLSRIKRAGDRYYIHSTRPFFVRGRIYYEVTFCRAVNRVSKVDRIIAFTRIDIGEKYSATLSIYRDSIEVLGQTMPITIIGHYEVSIRPCEIDNFARLLGITTTTRTNSEEYLFLMGWLTTGSGSLVDLLDMSDEGYAIFREAGTAKAGRLQVFPVLDQARRLVRRGASGQNILRYLMLRMHNQTLKMQYERDGCGDRLSGMKLKYGCIPFDTMPFCTSLPGHNPRYWDLVESLDVTGRKHEMLARRVKNNVERHGALYTPIAELEEFGDVCDLISGHNDLLYHKHLQRQLVLDMKHVFICEHEDRTVSIIQKLQEYASSGIDGYSEAVERWIEETPGNLDDPAKEQALIHLFSQSKVALIYGAAGTGKSTMVNHIANYFNDKQKLFLAHTHPAVDNLKRKITTQQSDFRTIASHINRKSVATEYDLVVIDECSTVSNADLMQVLEKTSFKLLVLVGDIHQIESIQFGNWFEIIRSFLPKASVFELTTPFRTKNDSLLRLWDRVRGMHDDIAEVMAHNGYSTVLDKSLFQPQQRDEIILCLNYDGLYGINNVNRFLQSGNPNDATTWRVLTYKVGDPVLFNEIERFRPVIYNNLKGWIVGIERVPGRIQFDVKLDRPITELDIDNDELEWMGDSTVRFSVYEVDTSDEDDDSLNTIVPFQVAYAVSIHKAQGLEYDSVKVVITDANEDEISHSIFYTAITRAREKLRVFWTPETQQAVLRRLGRVSNNKDVVLLSKRRGLASVH